jgi:hypothetical protein
VGVTEVVKMLRGCPYRFRLGAQLASLRASSYEVAAEIVDPTGDGELAPSCRRFKQRDHDRRRGRR